MTRSTHCLPRILDNCFAQAALLAALALAVFLPALCRAESRQTPQIIQRVRFEGLKTLTHDQLIKKIKSKPGTPYDSDLLTEDLKRLAPLAWNWPEIRADKLEDGLGLVFVLKENPTLEEIHFVGNSQIETKNLAKSVRIKPGDILTRDTVATTENTIREAYRSQGYLRTEVKASLAQKGADENLLEEADSQVLQVIINEGRKIKVDDLKILGNDNFTDMRLKLALETKGSWLFAKNYFDESAYQADLEELRQFYQRSGYFDVTVERGIFEENEKKATITPAIIVSEGPRYRFGEVSTRGNTYFAPEEIETYFTKLNGKKFKAKDYDLAVKKVRALYDNAGFVTAEIHDSLDFDQEHGEVNIALAIDENARAEIGKILVERNETLSDQDSSWFVQNYQNIAPPVDNDAIAREITLQPGETYDKRRETESLARLRNLGIFEKVEIESRATDDPNVRDVLIRVEEGVTGNVMLGAGFSEYFGGYFMASYKERNFLGQADNLMLNIMVGTKVINGAVTYYDRRIGDTRNSLLTELHRLRAHRPGYNETNTGLLAELGIPWKNKDSSSDERWKTFLRGRLEYVQINDDEEHPSDDFDVSYPVAALRARLVNDTRLYEDYRGVRSFATGGHLASIGLEGGFADGPLAKLTAQYNWFRKIGDNLVFSSDWRLGFMPIDADRIGPSERLYLGGTKDLRGYQWRQAGPHDKGDNDVPLGGATKVLARNELRYPLTDNITGVYFLDLGMLEENALSFNSPRGSTGIGVRFEMRNFEAGVDLALPFSAQKDDQKRYFHLNLSALTEYQQR